MIHEIDIEDYERECPGWEERYLFIKEILVKSGWLCCYFKRMSVMLGVIKNP